MDKRICIIKDSVNVMNFELFVLIFLKNEWSVKEFGRAWSTASGKLINME